MNLWKISILSISQGDLVVYDEDDEEIDFETLNDPSSNEIKEVPVVIIYLCMI